MPQLTRSDIAHMVVSDDTPFERDGISNLDRTAFVCEAFQRPYLSMQQDLPYEEALQCHDETLVQASIYMAHLQHQYTAIATADGHYEEDVGNFRCARLQLAAMKLQWHLDHLRRNEFTPSFPFVH
ncbi:hypothetical protein LAV_00079 [Sphingobium phage Lacusarx]|uniref:Uncharacterized protein n=1 Tax=Sphingobium phage Lacusarx TaxID=1980139 RepID=A0A1W6DX66_9CAUD|nr:hypothetical protein FDH44_gp079 [Sphingobium phage Lacusarx]ARK07479.1 hypothetical protein LAV_00079 [Sphingobium phage Lacusarx]